MRASLELSVPLYFSSGDARVRVVEVIALATINFDVAKVRMRQFAYRGSPVAVGEYMKNGESRYVTITSSVEKVDQSE